MVKVIFSKDYLKNKHEADQRWCGMYICVYLDNLLICLCIARVDFVVE